MWMCEQIYWFGPLLGAVFAGAVYDVIFSTKSSFRRVRACLLVFHHHRDSHVIETPVDVIDYVGTGQIHHLQKSAMATHYDRNIHSETRADKTNNFLKNEHEADDDAEEDDGSDGECSDGQEMINVAEKTSRQNGSRRRPED
jgi:hypothetical protein